MRLTFNFDWIDDRLAVGGSFPMEAAEQLARSERIGGIVDLRVEACDDEATLRVHGVDSCTFPPRIAAPSRRR